MPADSASFALQVIENLQQTIDEMVRDLRRQNDWLNPRVQSLARLYLAALRQYQNWTKIVLSAGESQTVVFPQNPKNAHVSPAALLDTPKSTNGNAPRMTPKLGRITPAPPSAQPAPIPAPGLLRSVPQPPLHGGTPLDSSPTPEPIIGQKRRTG